MSLRNGDSAMAMHVMVKSAVSHVLTVTENGYGKLSVAEDYPEKGRGTMGVISIQTTDRNGPVVAAIPVHTDDQVMIATADGQMIRMKVKDISVMGRNTQGVRLFSTDGAKVKLVTRLSTSVLGGDDDSTPPEAESDAPLPVSDEAANEEKVIN
jgi:DNA gyrase subunit A